jgi:CheY-specific phosphatase CheX
MFDEIRKAASSAALNIFETMFFTFLDPLDEEASREEAVGEQGEALEPPTETIQTWVLITELPFSGDHSGVLRLFMPYELSATLAENFLGFDEEVTDVQILDMAGELANMICGNMFSSLDKKAVYLLGSPITQKISAQEKGDKVSPSDITLDFLAEGYTITIQLHFDSLL